MNSSLSVKVLLLLIGVGSLSACGDDAVVTPATSTTPESISLEFVSRFRHASATGFADGAAEIVAYDAASKRAFVVNGETDTIDVLNLSNPASPMSVGTLNLDLVGLTNPGRSPNSVAVKNGIVAVAVEDSPKTNPGKIGLYNASTLAFISSVTVGALPDMLTFTPDGTKVLVADEGEPAGYLTGQADPEGSVSIVTVTNPVVPTVQTVGFTSLNTQLAKLRNAGIRLFGPTNGSPMNTTVATDLEPEYIAVSSDGLTAYVGMQENNALATINIATATLTGIVPLGAKNHSLVGNALDASDRDGLLTSSNSAAPRVETRPVFGLYMPDGIATYRVNGQDFIVTANEGDAREYEGLLGGVNAGVFEREDPRLSTLDLDDALFPNETTLKQDVNLGRLRVSVFSGNLQVDAGETPALPQLEQIFSFGARSFSIFRPNGSLVFDSGSDFEDIISSIRPATFNAGHENNSLDDRSPAKGPEPESVELATLGNKTYALIGLERDSGIMIYDITDPLRPFFVNYVNSRIFGSGSINDSNFATFGDLGPESIEFIPAADSPNGQPLVLVANEVSGTTAIFRVVQSF